MCQNAVGLKNKTCRHPNAVPSGTFGISENFGMVAAVSIFVYLPMHLVLAFVPLPENPQRRAPNDFAILLYTFIAVLAVFEPLAIAAYCTICRLCAEGKKPDFPNILDHSLHKWAKLVFTFALYMMLVVMSAPLVILPIYFAVTYFFGVYVTATRGNWGLRAFAESRRLVKGRWFFTAGFFMILVSTAMILGEGFSVLLSLFTHNIVLLITARTFVSIVSAYFSIVVALYFLNIYYLDQKKE